MCMDAKRLTQAGCNTCNDWGERGGLKTPALTAARPDVKSTQGWHARRLMKASCKEGRRMGRLHTLAQQPWSRHLHSRGGERKG